MCSSRLLESKCLQVSSYAWLLCIESKSGNQSYASSMEVWYETVEELLQNEARIPGWIDYIVYDINGGCHFDKLKHRVGFF